MPCVDTARLRHGFAIRLAFDSLDLTRPAVKRVLFVDIVRHIILERRLLDKASRFRMRLFSRPENFAGVLNSDQKIPIRDDLAFLAAKLICLKLPFLFHVKNSKSREIIFTDSEHRF